MRFLLAIATLLTGVGGDTALAGPPVPFKNTCTLASAADLAAVFKMQLKVGADVDGMCLYNDSKGKMASMLSASSVDTAAMAKQAFDYAGKDSVKPVEVVPGVGDEAMITYPKSGERILVIRKGTTLMLLFVSAGIGSNFSDLKPGIIQIGKQAAGRL